MGKFTGSSFKTKLLIAALNSKIKEDPVPLIEDFAWHMRQVGEYPPKC
jgi:hypothetical protein